VLPIISYKVHRQRASIDVGKLRMVIAQWRSQREQYRTNTTMTTHSLFSFRRWYNPKAVAVAREATTAPAVVVQSLDIIFQLENTFL
jgi:hypothetical protein